MAKQALVITLKNEEKSVDALMASIAGQSVIPDEIAIVDAQSTDNTVKNLKRWKKTLPQLNIVSLPSNRAKGRNAAIEHTSAPIIAITDGGCIPEKHWFERITHPLIKGEANCVSGYYASTNVHGLKGAMTAFMLVMPRNVDPNHFLPATRSMAVSRETWKTLGGFPENLNSSEDYIFAKRMEHAGEKFVFIPNAVVSWDPPTDLKDFLKKIEEFAEHDIRGGVRRPKVFSIFFRYLVFFGIAYYNLYAFIAMLALYMAWSIWKHREDVPSDTFVYFPLLQVSSDITVMYGTLKGLLT